MEIWIKQDIDIRFADDITDQDKMEKIDYKFNHAMAKLVKISLISKNKSSKLTSEAKKEHVEKLANLNVPKHNTSNC